MSLELPFKIDIKNPAADIDKRKGPHNSIQEALDATEGTRDRGLNVYIIIGDELKEYWFKDGILDEHLVEKENGGGGETYYEGDNISIDENNTISAVGLVPKTREINTTQDLTGGGDLNTDLEIGLSQDVKNDISEGVYANEALKTLGGRNLILGTLEQGQWSINTGEKSPNANRVRNRYKTPVKPNTKYTIKNHSSNADIYILYFNYEKQFIRYEGPKPNGYKFETDVNTHYITFNLSTTSGATVNDLVKLERGVISTDWTPAPEDKEDAFNKNSAFNKDFGNTGGTVMEGNDGRIADGGVARTSKLINDEYDLNTLITPGYYYYIGNNQPINSPTLITEDENEKFTLEITYSENNNKIGARQWVTITERNLILSRTYKDDETWTPWQRLATQDWVNNNFPTFPDLYGSNTVIEGGYSLLPGETHKYSAWASKYVIDGEMYTNLIRNDNITLAAPHPTLRRFDLIVVNSDDTITVITGDPAENPVRPNFDKTTQVDLTFIYVNSVAEGGDNPGKYVLLYDENEGWPNESNASTNLPNSVEISSSERAYRGSKSIKFKGYNYGDPPAIITFTLQQDDNLKDYSKMVFQLGTPISHEEYGGKFTATIEFKKSGSLIHTEMFSGGVEFQEWVPILIPINYRGEDDGFNQIVVNLGNSHTGSIDAGTFFDYIYLTADTGTGGSGGTQQLIERTSQIPINDGNTGESRYVEEDDLKLIDLDFFNNVSDDPYIRESDLPEVETFIPAEHDLDEFKNESLNRYAKMSDIPMPPSPFNPTTLASTSVLIESGKAERAALTGDVTASQNSNTLTISNGAVTESKLATAVKNKIDGKLDASKVKQDLNTPTTTEVISTAGLKNELKNKQPKDLVYATITAMLADQSNQVEGVVIRVTDASADTRITFPTGANKVAYYQKLATSTASLIDDYVLNSAPFGQINRTGVEVKSGNFVFEANKDRWVYMVDSGIATLLPESESKPSGINYPNGYQIAIASTGASDTPLILSESYDVVGGVNDYWKYSINGGELTNSASVFIQKGGTATIVRKANQKVFIIYGSVI